MSELLVLKLLVVYNCIPLCFFSMDIININYSVFIPLLETSISILRILSFDIFEVIDDLNNIFALEI